MVLPIMLASGREAMITLAKRLPFQAWIAIGVIVAGVIFVSKLHASESIPSPPTTVTPASSASQADRPVTSSNEPTIEDHTLFGGDVDDLAQRFNQQASKLEFNVRMQLIDCSAGSNARTCQYKISNELEAVASKGKDDKKLDGVIFLFGGKDTNVGEFTETIATTINLFAPEAGREEMGQTFRSLFFTLPVPEGKSREATLRGVKFSLATVTNMGIILTITTSQ
jgi:hypothetical protein